MNKFKRIVVAAVFGLGITTALVFFMMVLIGLNQDEPQNHNFLTTQVKVSAQPGLMPSVDINSDSLKKHYQLPSKRSIKLPIDHRQLLSDLRSQEVDGDQTDRLAAPARQQLLLLPGSNSQAVVKEAGLFNVIGPDPVYPTDALLSGQEGWVDAMIHLHQDGTVVRVDILDAGPTGIFEEAVVTAVSDWQIQLDKIEPRFLADEYYHRFEFRIKP